MKRSFNTLVSSLKSFLSNLGTGLKQVCKSPSSPHRNRRVPLGLECLEERDVPSTVVPNYNLATLASFNGDSTGANSMGGLVRDSSGDLFGTTSGAGAFGYGTVFEIPHGSNTIITLASFNGDSTGANPWGNLVLDSSGDLFGTTMGGGTDGYGTVFEVVHGSNSITTLASFNGDSTGAYGGGLVMDSSGDLFGTTWGAGTFGYGTVFEVAHGSNSITTLASFNGDSTGANPLLGSLVVDSSGDLFGAAGGGGTFGYGTVFEVVHGSNSITTLASFNGDSTGGAGDGLVMDSSGDLFGTTWGAGAFGYGTVFEVVRGSNSITTLASFNGDSTGANPWGQLVLDSNGDLFGSTEGAGAAGYGTVFEVAHGSNSITTLASFNGTSTGANDSSSESYSGLVMDNSGDLYGTTWGAGADGYGTVFELTPPAQTQAATQVAYHTGAQTLTAGVNSGTITVQLEDASGNPVAATSSVTISLSSSDGGTFFNGTTPITSITIAAGSSSASFTYENTTAGSSTLTASANGLTSVHQTETVQAAAPAKLSFVSQPLTTGITAGSTFGATVQVTDKYGNPVAGVSVSLSLGSSTITGITNPAGQAVFSNLSETVAGTYTLKASVAGQTSISTSSFTIKAGAAAKLAFVTLPSSVSAGSPFGAVVQVVDQYGNAVAQSGVVVSLALSSGTLSGSLTATTNSAGEALFSNLSDTVAGSYSLSASATGLKSGSNSLTITALAAAKLSWVTAPPSSVVAGSPFGATVEVTDKYGNPVAGVSVSLSLSSGTLSGTTTIITNAAGQAVFSKLSDKVVGSSTLKATATGLTALTIPLTIKAAA